MDSLWTIEMFGGLAAVRHGVRTTRFATQKTASLLAFLAFYSRKSHLRDSLVEMLWPDSEPAQGRSRLSTLLSYLRSLLEPPGTVAGSVLEADRNSVRLNAEQVRTDASRFEALLVTAGKTADPSEQIALLQEARDLYRGDLLPGFYEDWVVREQARLRDKYVDLLHVLAHGLYRARQRGEAIATLDAAIEADPYREAPVRMQMRCYAGMGRPGAALNAYQQLVDRLQEGLGARPSEATLELAEQLRVSPEAFDPGEEQALLEAPAPTIAGVVPKGRAEPATTSAHPDLPMQLTRLMGRQQELNRLTDALIARENRLITLTGPGGTGKTRLAIEAAARAAEHFRGRVWFVDLARINHARLFPFALAESLHLQASSQIDPLDQALERLNEAPCLLILDNFEHLLRNMPGPGKSEDPIGNTGAGMMRLLLERAPSATCLVTSRQPLHLGGEREMPVPMLPVPAVGETVERVAACESVALYVDRARASRPDFTLSEHNVSEVAELCRRLEGMPLAIEMAAAWSKTVTPTRMLERLNSHLDALTSRRRDLPLRHQSMRAVIEWSYDLLDEPLQRLFCHLSAFRGGWTQEDAEWVCDRNDLVADLLELGERSLIVQEERDGEIRFRYLETLRTFAAERLAGSAEASWIRERHYTCFLNLAETSRDGLYSPDADHWFKRLAAEQDNFRLVLLQADRGEPRLRLAVALWRYWYERGQYAEARRWLTQGLGECGMECSGLHASGLTAIGAMASNQGDYPTARDCFEKARALWQAAGDRNGLADVMNNLGVLEYRGGNFASARDIFEITLALRRELGDARSTSTTLNNLAILSCDLGDFDAAERFHAENLALKRAVGDRAGVALALGNMGHVAYRQGAYSRASLLLEESLAEHRALGTHPGIAVTLHTLGNVLFEEERLTEALAAYSECIEIFREIGEMRGIAYALGQISGVVLRMGDAARAVRCAAEAEQICRELDDRSGLASSWIRMGNALLHQRPVEAGPQLRQGLAAGRDLGNERLQFSAIEALAHLAVIQGEPFRAARLFGFSRRAFTELRFSWAPTDRVEHDRERSAVGAKIGITEQERLEREGATWSLAEAAAYALETTGQ